MKVTVSWGHTVKQVESLEAGHALRRWLVATWPALEGKVTVRGEPC
jgi:hypothetical protein